MTGTTHFPHGWLGAEADWGGCCPTIDASAYKIHTILIEVKKVEDSRECRRDQDTGKEGV